MATPITLSEDQFRQLLAAAKAGPVEPPVGAGMATGAAALVGEMPRCSLGKDKLKRYKRWKEWLNDAENKMRFLKIANDKEKIDFLRSCGGPELTEFWNKEARITFEEEGTYSDMITETKKALLKYVNKDRALIDLLRMKQGNRSFMDFLSEVEDQEYLCRIDEQPLTGEDLKRISLIAGMRDRTLAEKALAEEYSLTDVIKTGITREASKANADAIRMKTTPSINRVEDYEKKIEDLQLDVMRLQHAGKYSRKFKPQDSEKQKFKSNHACETCTYKHPGRRCPAEERYCNACGEKGHFARSARCKMIAKRTTTTRRVEENYRAGQKLIVLKT